MIDILFPFLFPLSPFILQDLICEYLDLPLLLLQIPVLRSGDRGVTIEQLRSPGGQLMRVNLRY